MNFAQIYTKPGDNVVNDLVQTERIRLVLGVTPAINSNFEFSTQWNYLSKKTIYNIQALSSDDIGANTYINGVTYANPTPDNLKSLALILEDESDQIQLNRFPLAMLNDLIRSGGATTIKAFRYFDLKHIRLDKSRVRCLQNIPSATPMILTFDIKFT